MIKPEEIKGKYGEAKLLLCFVLSCFLFFGSFTHSFVQYEVGFTTVETSLQTASDTTEHSHSHSHFHDMDTDGFEDNQRHLHKHNPLDHSHDQPIVLAELPETTLGYGLLHLAQTAQCMNNQDCSSLERPPKQTFLINLS